MPAPLVSFYQKIILRYPLFTLITAFAVALVMALGLSNFKLDASADSLTLEHDEDLNFFREVIQRYGSTSFLIVTFSPKSGDLFDDANLQTLQALRNDLSLIQGIDSVTSLVDLPLLYSPKIKVADLKTELNTLLSKDVDKELAKQEFLNSPIYQNLVLSPDGQTTGILATLELDNTYLELVKQRDSLRLKRNIQGLSPEEQLQLDQVSEEFLNYRTEKAKEDHQRVGDVRALLDTYRDRATIFLGGPDMITADMIAFIKGDLLIFGIGILLFIVLIMSAIFRQVRWVVLPLTTCGLCILIMLGFLSWIDWRLTVISSNFVSLLLIITLAINIHLVVRYRELHRTQPDLPQEELVLTTIRSMAKPCFYTVLTTIVAFSSLVVSNIRPVIDFGWMMTIGISLSLILAFTIIPAGLMLIGKGKKSGGGDNFANFTTRFAAFTEHHGTLLLLLSLVLACTAAYGISRLEVENRFIDYFRSDTEIYQGMEVIDAALGGTTPLDIVLTAPAYTQSGDNDFSTVEDDEYGDGSDPFEDITTEEDPYAEEDPFGKVDPFAELENSEENSLKDTYWFTSSGIEDLKKLQNFLDAQPEIGKVSSLVQLYQVASDLNGHQLNDFEIAFMRKSLSEDIYQQLVAPYLIEDVDEARIQMRAMETKGLLRRAELLEKIRHYAVNEVGIPEENIRFTGLLVLYNNMLQSLFQSQILTLGAVFLGIMLMFLVLFRSLIISVIAILPNFLAAGVVLGSMGLAGVPLDMMTITIAAITVGIGVDDTIHYIHRFKTEFKKDRDYMATMYRAHGSIGHAMYYTSVIIVVGFSILSLSNFIPSVYFGLLTGFAMIAALLGAMTLLPKLILITRPFGKGG